MDPAMPSDPFSKTPMPTADGVPLSNSPWPMTIRQPSPSVSDLVGGVH
jgi:hypothetical protein